MRMKRTFWISFCICVGTFLALILKSQEVSAKVYRPGFSYSKLDAYTRARITGVTYRKNPYISYGDLRYVRVKHYDFKGNIKDGELIVNKKIASRTVKIFYELYKMKYPIGRMRLVDDYSGVDDVSMAANNTSAFNYRRIAGKKKLSNHSYGLAIDINPRINPYITASKVSPANGRVYQNRNKNSCKGKYAKWMITSHSKIVKIFKKYGFTWGGDWTHSKDYQHFEHK